MSSEIPKEIVHPIVLFTALPEVVLRELTEEDDVTFFEAVIRDRKNLRKFASNTVRKYQSLQDVRNARLNPEGRLRLGIWGAKRRFLGAITATPGEEDNSEMEVGYWVSSNAQGRGYATAAVRALTAYLIPRYTRIFAEVHVENEASKKILRHAGYSQAGNVEREWGLAVVFEVQK